MNLTSGCIVGQTWSRLPLSHDFGALHSLRPEHFPSNEHHPQYGSAD